MADPLSITTGVIGLLGTCIKVAAAIKDFHDGAALADVAVKGLLTEVENFSRVLSTMKSTLEEQNVRSSLQSTGHIGNHLDNLSQSIMDGQTTLDELQTILDKVNKDVRLLNGARKHLRLKGASEEIIIFQQQIRTYRDTIQLSLQTVILWNQVTLKASTDTILVNLDEFYESVRRIAFDINTRINNLTSTVESSTKTKQVQTLTRLRNCIQSAASVVSSASTTLSEYGQGFTYESECGDCFPMKSNEPMRRWISSSPIYEFEEESQSTLSNSKTVFTERGPNQVGDLSDSEHFDSDTELEFEMVNALLQQGKQNFNDEDFSGAEHLFQNCLTMAKSDGSFPVSHHNLLSEVMTMLVETYRKQEKWNGAHSVLKDKISAGSRYAKIDKADVLRDKLTLAEVLFKKEEYTEAYLYGREAYNGYRRIGPPGNESAIKALRLIADIHHAEGNLAREEGCRAVLSTFIKQSTVKIDSPSREGHLNLSQSSTAGQNRSFIEETNQKGVSPGITIDKDQQAISKQVVSPRFQVQAWYKYISDHKDDLCFGAGQVITVTEDVDEGWYEGEYKDTWGTLKTGLFPKCFVDKYRSVSSPGPSSTLTTNHMPSAEDIPGQHAATTLTEVPRGPKSGTYNTQATDSVHGGIPNICKRLIIVGDDYFARDSLFKELGDSKAGVTEFSQYREYTRSIPVNNKVVELTICEITSSLIDPYKSLFPLGDVILVCFPIDHPIAVSAVNRWTRMASDIYPEQPVILLGTGIENRKLTKQARKRLHLRRVGSGALGEPISRQEGKDLAKKVGACKYLECSTSTGEGVSEVLEYAVRMALSYTPPKKKKWFSLTRNK